LECDSESTKWDGKKQISHFSFALRFRANSLFKQWTATLQTNQKALEKSAPVEASRSVRAFSLSTEQEARALAIAWTPPEMLPFSDFQVCHICKAKFALLRRACHCRNCGVCICKECSLIWPGKMVPATYNYKNENSINVCKSCDWLCNSFRLALLDGDYDRTLALYSTGNVNLFSPFANVKGELLFPVHCAVLGRNLDLLKFLVDENCCPISCLSVIGRSKDSGAKNTPIVTSKGRSLLRIALELNSIQMIRYLVVEKGLSIFSEKELSIQTLCQNLTLCLNMLPSSHAAAINHDNEASIPFLTTRPSSESNGSLESQSVFGDLYERFVDQGNEFGEENLLQGSLKRDGKEDCIICFDAAIDCVATPCGHQMCCLTCSAHINKCPVCSMNCSFLRVYKS
jgi:FYVE zinc finger/Zinc finger, C3HC4 type (RING finger)